MADAVESLRKALKKRNTDRFEVGAVIRWIGAERYNYAAIKTGIGWFTTARGYSGNTVVAKVYDYDDLIEYLAKSDVSGLEVAVMWEEI